MSSDPQQPDENAGPNSLPPEYYAAIGRVAAAWSHFETMMNLTIWELANVQQHLGACFTSQMIGPGPRIPLSPPWWSSR